MKSLYITAVVTFSGKTALALGIGLKLQADGRKVGYLKPVSTQPYLFEGKVVDEDADFVRRTLGLDTPASEGRVRRRSQPGEADQRTEPAHARRGPLSERRDAR